ncbi:hypothetical protein Pmar_PMAR003768, partial [Perkinsus marinus ATCC 50983]
YGYYDLAADVLAENPALTYSCLEPDEYEFLNSLILSQASPEEGVKQLAQLARKHIEKLRTITKAIQEGRKNRDKKGLKIALKEFEEALDEYIPVLMAEAKIYWEMEDYQMVEHLFRQSAEFCSEDERWRLNVAHVFFMQEKFEECIRYYAKRCFLALAENMAKDMVVIRDDTYHNILNFLDRAARHGKHIETVVSPIDMEKIIEVQNAAAQAAADAVGESSEFGRDENNPNNLGVAAAVKSAAAAAAVAAASINKKKNRTVT